MGTTTIKVTPKSKKELELIAMALLETKIPERHKKPGKLDLLDIFNNRLSDLFGFTMDINESLPDEIEGITDFKGKRLILSGTTHTKLEQDDPRARFTMAHEISHTVLHSHFFKGEKLYESSRAKRLNRGDLPAYEDAEWQADYCAAGLLMPYHHVISMLDKAADEYDLIRVFGVSYKAAQKRIRYVKQGF